MRPEVKTMPGGAVVRGIAAVLCALPCLAQAEGAVTAFDCTVDSICEAEAACVLVGVPVALTVSPVAIAADGSGDVIVGVGAGAWDGTADGFAGPFRWTDEGVDNVLTVLDESAVTWERTPQEAPGEATTSFLTCEVTQ